MSNYLDDYVSVQDRLKEFINAYPDYQNQDSYIGRVACLIAMSILLKLSYIGLKLTLHPWTTGLSSESKSKQYALELAETGSLGRALNLAGYFAKVNQGQRSQLKRLSQRLRNS
jgi:hypothetical protein